MKLEYLFLLLLLFLIPHQTSCNSIKSLVKRQSMIGLPVNTQNEHKNSFAKELFKSSIYNKVEYVQTKLADNNIGTLFSYPFTNSRSQVLDSKFFLGYKKKIK